MSASFKSKHGTVSRPPEALYAAFSDLRNFTAMLPEDKRQMIQAQEDSLKVCAQNMTLGVKVSGRVPCNLIQFQDDGAPFNFGISIHFDETDDPGKTDFSLEVDADMNFMMKMMLGSRIQEGLDKVVDGLVATSEGRMPEGVDPDTLKNFHL